MRRRTLLAAIPAGAVSVAGCLSTGSEGADSESADGDDRRYEECNREIVPYDMLPDPIRTEVDAAREDGYEAARIYLAEAMDIEGSYVSVDGTYYDPSVTETDDRKRLTLRAVEPKALPTERPVYVEQLRDGERTITVSLTAEDGTTLIDATRDLHPGGEVEFGTVRRVGSHDLRVTVGDEAEAELSESVTINESRFDIRVVIEDTESYVTGAVADIGRCQFDE
ncbi:hypothetical protein [Halohasta salina]|uniref:hypothetical protein n=1 Tax=Halohasta salina TaxID=2961621 RepID=UPI0020A3F0E9|nr:hypothetical protein [Halohasta salina]